LQKLRAHVGAKDSYRILDPNVLRAWPHGLYGPP
jgi:hypothetical protein